ncbi:ABC transporter substrate-binding protein [Paenibacillus nasutitermitis]|uniref:ABC transporter substrate-binding protein n=1 Tax=Paenibacillus nasutitermitis TaxID=1652958 RepID=A0A916ZA39_9BACL|nr:ABC transporter substrate-binding protein [Paenibacillus nasutitermitis]GGD83159.1 ABC transporter substrate-binding protein [Paenibacillus nasutitermitis]
MNIKKSAFILIAVLLFVSLLSACSSSNNNKPAGNAEPSPSNSPSGETTAPADTAEPVKISFWHIYSDGPMKTLMDQLLADFQKEHKNITVDQLGVNFFDYWTKLSTAMAAGSGPDLALNDTSTLPSRAKSGAILNVDSFIEKDGVNLADFFPVLVDKMKYDGKMFGMPNDTDVRVLYYNKKMFKDAGLDPNKPPANWDELEQYADKLTKWNDKKMLDVIGFSPSIGNLHLWTMAWANGGGFWDDQGKPTFNKPENVEALTWMKKIQDKYGVKAMSAFNSQASALGFSPFIAGKAAMVVDVNNLYQDIKTRAPDMEFGIAPIPYTKTPASWSAGFDLELVNNKDDKRAAAAWELMKYLTSADVQVKIHEASGSLVSNVKAAQDPKFMNDENWKMIVDQMKVSRFIEYVEAMPSWHGNLDPVEQSVLNSGKDPQKALDEAQKNAENALANFGKTQ